MSLAFASDVADEAAENAMVGSPFLDVLIAFASARGAVSERHLPAGRLRRSGLKPVTEQTLRFANCRTRYLEDEAEVRLAATAPFDFRVTFFSEERRERMDTVPVGLHSGHVALGLDERLRGFGVRDASDLVLPEAPGLPIAEAYASAREALRDLVAAEAARQQARGCCGSPRCSSGCSSIAARRRVRSRWSTTGCRSGSSAPAATTAAARQPPCAQRPRPGCCARSARRPRRPATASSG